MSRTQQLPENSIVADPDTQPPQKPFSWAATGGVRHMAQELRLSRCAARIRSRHRGVVIGKSTTAAIGVQTSPSTDTKLDPNRLTLSGKVLDPPPPPG